MKEKQKPISKIREEFEAASMEKLPSLYREYQEDTRAGVRSLIDRYRKKEEALEKEKARTEQMKVYERQYEARGYVCGIDEVGRGPLAGPVVAGAVILPKDCGILWLNDSKKLTARKREELYDVIMEQAVAVGLGCLMEEYDREIPGYGFASNKGYGSEQHIEALKKYGPSPIHRKTFLTHFL